MIYLLKDTGMTRAQLCNITVLTTENLEVLEVFRLDCRKSLTHESGVSSALKLWLLFKQPREPENFLCWDQLYKDDNNTIGGLN